jgi:LexA-binding, inner membrane-associated putative hydrolase
MAVPSVGRGRLLAGAPARISAALARRTSVRSRLVLGSLVVVGIADLLIWRWKGAPYAVQGLLDEPAHAATGVLALATVARELQTPVVLAVLAGSLLIDADHLPHVLGSHVFEHGVPRPYTHSLGTIVVLAAVTLLLRGEQRRQLMLIVTLTLALHFFRDSAEPGGPGVSLLWPVSDHGVTVGYGWYAAVLAGLSAIALGRARRQARSIVR